MTGREHTAGAPAGTPGGLGSMADRWERTAGDTPADDCAEGFLGELDEVLWIMQESQRTDANLFRHAARKSDHVTEFRRLLRRLHAVLVGWEEEAAMPSPRP